MGNNLISRIGSPLDRGNQIMALPVMSAHTAYGMAYAPPTAVATFSLDSSYLVLSRQDNAPRKLTNRQAR